MATRELRADFPAPSATRAIAIAPDGTWFTTAGRDGVVRLWDRRLVCALVDLRDVTGPAPSGVGNDVPGVGIDSPLRAAIPSTMRS